MLESDRHVRVTHRGRQFQRGVRRLHSFALLATGDEAVEMKRNALREGLQGRQKGHDVLASL